MKTRNAGGTKPSPTAKKTPPVRKSASKTKASPSLETPKTAETKRSSARASKQVKKTETTPVSDSNRRRSSGEDDLAGSPASIVRRTSGRVRTPATPTSVYVSAQAEYAKMKGKALSETNDTGVEDVEEAAVKEDVMAVDNVGVSATDGESAVVGVEIDGGEDGEGDNVMREIVFEEEGKSSENVQPCDERDPVELEGSVIEEDRVENQEATVEDIAKSSESIVIRVEEDYVEKTESIVEEVTKSSESIPPCDEGGHVEEVAKPSENHPSCDEKHKSIVEYIAKSSESILIPVEEDHVKKNESVIEEITKSSENVLPSDEHGPLELEGSEIEKVAKFSESLPPCGEQDPVEKQEPIVEGIAESSESMLICVGEDHVEKKESVVEEFTKSSVSIPSCDEGDHVEEVAKSSESHRPCDEENLLEKHESKVEAIAKSSDSMLFCVKEVHHQKKEFIVEEITKSSECILPCDEGGYVEKVESVVEEVGMSSKKESPCDVQNSFGNEESVVTRDVTKSVITESPCNTRPSVDEKLTRNLENETSCAEELHNNIEESIAEVVTKSSENELACDVRERMGVIAEQEESKDADTEVTCFVSASKEQTDQARLHGADTDLAKEIYDVEYGEKLDLEEREEEELAGDGAKEQEEESMNLGDECKQLTAIAKERKIKKDREVFIDGLDPDVEEEDVRKVFEIIGRIVEVRMQKSPSTNKNKGYTFVEFKNEELATRALFEMKNPVIRGKLCRTSPSEDNTTLFIGNICNTWTKEAIKQKLQEYEVEGVENINLVPDVKREGLSRGFAFVEFSCHGDAMLAYKRLQQLDVIFGHPERTCKVGFAKRKCEPNPEVMSQVKSIFVDGLPPHWDEKQVREQFECYGEIVRVVLARNMSTAKRKDFGFVDFSSHESAVASVNVINNTQLGDENLKINLKARLSNPLPKTQAVKGGIRGGFRIGSSVARFGRDSGHTGHAFNLANHQRASQFYDGGQTCRLIFKEYDYNNPHPEFQGRGGRRGFSRGGQFSSGRGSGVASPSPRFYVDRSSHDAPYRGRGMPAPSRRHPYPLQGHFDGPQRTGQIDGPHMRGHFNGPHMMGHFNQPHIRGHLDGPHMSAPGPNLRGHFVGPHMRGRVGGPHIGGRVDQPQMDGHFYEPLFDDGRGRTQGMKRPFPMREYNPGYSEPSRARPRLNYNDPTSSFHLNDTTGAGIGLYRHDSHGPQPQPHYGPHASYYGPNQSYGGVAHFRSRT